jgi:hypothetical protein
MDATRSFKRVNTRGGDASVTAILDGNRKHRARACEATTGIEPVCSKSVVPLVAHRGTSKQLMFRGRRRDARRLASHVPPKEGSRIGRNDLKALPDHKYRNCTIRKDVDSAR